MDFKSRNKNNRSNNTLVTYKGETHTLAEWADIFGISYNLLLYRYTKSNMSFEEALTMPCEKRERIITYKGKTQNLRQWSEELNLPYSCIRSRLNNLHWTVEKAFETPYMGLFGNNKEGNND